MATNKVAVTRTKLDTLANSIGSKSGEGIPLTLDEMAAAVEAIEVLVPQTKTVTPGDTQQIITPDIDQGYNGLTQVTVAPSPNNVIVQETYDENGGSIYTITTTKDPIYTEELNVTTNGTYEPSESNHYYSSVNVNVAGGSSSGGNLIISDTIDTAGGVIREITTTTDPVMLTTKNITSNGTYYPYNDDADGYSEVVVNVSGGGGSTPNLQAKTGITPTGSSQTITPDTGYDGLSSVQINGDANLIATNIKKNVQIFGVTGSYETIDCPTFTCVVNNSGEFTNVTCDKTYTECINYCQQYVGVGKLEIDVSPRNYGLNVEYDPNESDIITYWMGWDIGVFCIHYAPNNVITWEMNPITPRSSSDLTASNLTVTAPAGYYESAATKTLTDSNLIAGNIKSGISIFGVTGSYSGSGVSLQAKTGINPTTSSQTITADSGYDGLSSVQINAMPTLTLPTSATSSATSGYTSKATISRSTSDQYINIPTGYNSAGAYYKISAVANGSTTAPASISGISATISTGDGTLTLTKTVSVTPTVSAGYISTGTAGNSSVSLTASVTINPTPTASGATVTIPAGYYSTQTTKSVTTMTLPTSAASSATSGYTSKATISRSTSNQYINIPPGYNSAGGYYTISAVANGSATGPSSLSGTSATISTGTNTITLTKTGVSTTPTVSAGYVSSATSSTATVTLTASVTTKAATTYHPSTSDQTIASGTYTTGTQTIKAVTISGLSANNIISGVTVKVGDSTDDDCVTSVAGSVVIQHYYTGSGTPSSSTGENGDIYLKTS